MSGSKAKHNGDDFCEAATFTGLSELVQQLNVEDLYADDNLVDMLIPRPITSSNLVPSFHYTKVANFNSLPDEVVLHLFRWLFLKERCTLLPLVCKRWYRLARDSSLFRSLDLRYIELKFETAHHLLSFVQVVRPRQLWFRRCAVIQYLLPVLSRFCPDLELLSLDYCSLSEDVLKVFLLSVSTSKLKQIEITGEDVVNCNVIEHLCRCLPQLTHLTLSHCRQLCDKCVELLANSLPALRNLDLEGAEFITDESTASLLAAHASHLETLYLDGFVLSWESLQHLYCCTQLKVFSINYLGKADDRLLQAICAAAANTLQELYLGRHGLLSSAALESAFFQLHNLRHVALIDHEEMLDNSVQILVANCGAVLETLQLVWCVHLSDNVFHYVTQACPRLRLLMIFGNYTVTAIPLLAMNLDVLLPRFILLDLAHCDLVTREVLDELADRYPHLRVFDYEGDRAGKAHVHDPPHIDGHYWLYKLRNCSVQESHFRAELERSISFHDMRKFYERCRC